MTIPFISLQRNHVMSIWNKKQNLLIKYKQQTAAFGAAGNSDHSHKIRHFKYYLFIYSPDIFTSFSKYYLFICDLSHFESSVCAQYLFVQKFIFREELKNFMIPLIDNKMVCFRKINPVWNKGISHRRTVTLELLCTSTGRISTR